MDDYFHGAQADTVWMNTCNRDTSLSNIKNAFIARVEIEREFRLCQTIDNFIYCCSKLLFPFPKIQLSLCSTRFTSFFSSYVAIYFLHVVLHNIYSHTTLLHLNHLVHSYIYRSNMSPTCDTFYTNKYTDVVTHTCVTYVETQCSRMKIFYINSVSINTLAMLKWIIGDI